MPLFDRQTVGFFRYFLRAYPLRSALMVGLLALAGVLEGVGVVTLLPVLELATGTAAADRSGVSAAIAEGLAVIGLQPDLGVLLSVIVAVMVLKALLIWVAMKQVGYTVAQVTTDGRMQLLTALMAARWAYYTARPAGDFATALSSEAQRAAAAYREGCVIIAGILQVAVYFVVALVVSWQMALATLVFGFVFLYLLRNLVGMAREAGGRQTELTRSLLRRLTDALHAMKPIRAMARERHVQRLLERDTQGLNHALRRQVMAAETLRLFQEPTLVILLAAGLFAALSLGGQPFSAVMVLAFIFYRIMTHINTLQTRYQVLTKGESAFWALRKQVTEAEAEREELTGTRPPPLLTSEIRLEGVSFRYSPETPVLKNVSLVVPAGKLTALYGPSGVGKTTIADLVLGLLLPDEGRITIDGIPLDTIDLRAWREQIGYVPQEVILFHDTVLNNVALGDPTITRGEVREALKAADAWSFVADRPEGMDEIIGEGGARLSGGQRQRISIARALVHKPQLLILDEATTALDPVTEAEILSTLRSLRDSVTILAISHQPALKDAADAVYSLEEGVVRRITTTEPSTPEPVI